jgi:hypothetical protein
MNNQNEDSFKTSRALISIFFHNQTTDKENFIKKLIEIKDIKEDTAYDTLYRLKRDSIVTEYLDMDGHIPMVTLHILIYNIIRLMGDSIYE